MPIDEMIEQLSFGRSLPRIDSCLGLFLSPEVIFLAEVKMKGGRPSVLHLVRLPVPAEAASAKKTGAIGSLNTEFLADEQLVFGILEKALKDISWGSKHVMVTLSHHFGILRYFAMPAIDRRFWKTAVPAEAKKYVPIPFATLTHDYQVRELPSAPGGKPRIGALFGVTHKKNLDSVSSVMQKLGLTLIGTELAPCSVERLWDTIDPDPAFGPYSQVHFDGGHIRILISDGGLPIFFREVFLGNEATVLDRRKVDIVGCIDFTKKQIGSAGPKKLRLSGRIADIAAWQQALSQDVGQPAGFLDVDAALGLKGGQWGGYAAVGTALRHLGSTPLSLDLSAIGKISDDDRRAATTILVVSAILAGLLTAVGIYRYALILVKSRQLSSLTADAEIAEVFRGKTSSDIEYMMEQMREKERGLGGLVRKRVPLTRLFEVLADEIPEAAWLHELGYLNPIAVGRKSQDQPRSLRIDGKVIEAGRAVEQDVAYRFADKLRKEKNFSSAFKSVEISVEAQKQEAEGQESRAVGQEEALKDRLRRATDFKIQCLSEKPKSS